MSHQWRDFFVVAVRLEELAPAKQVEAREPAQPWIPSRNGPRQLDDDAIAPLGSGDLLADVLADLPVQADQLDVDSLAGAAFCSVDQ
jgi:hypothetical protein